jgi:predicted Ser/Thr protein kinase
LEKFVEKKGHARVPYAFILEGYHLGRWVSKIRKETVKKTTEQISRLDSLGFVWKVK